MLNDLETEDAGVEYVDLNGDGIMEIRTTDAVFNYWYTNYMDSPSPDVILSLQNGKYKADPKLMRKPAPPDDVIADVAKSAKDWNSYVSPVPWRYLLDLIYSGNLKSAQKYVDLAWGDGDKTSEFGTKANFWNELTKNIKTSIFYKDLSSFFGL